MRRHGKAAANTVIARQMQEFFKALSADARREPRRVAVEYGQHLVGRRRRKLVNEKRFASSRFHVGIGVGPLDFDSLTKRAVLVSDTLLLSHNGCGDRHRIADLGKKRRGGRVIPAPDSLGYDYEAAYSAYEVTAEKINMHCPDLDYLGQWLLDTEPLLCAGSAWYLPSYSVEQCRSYEDDNFTSLGHPQTMGYLLPGLLDFVQVGRRVIAQDDVPSVASGVVRPVINEINLPFLEGVPMDVFSAITVGEFDAYCAFRGWLRQELLNLDNALNAVESDRELAKISEQIQDGIRGVQSQMGQIRRKRAVEVTGAVVGTVSASLVAVYGPALEPAIAAVLGGAAGGGLWRAFQAIVDNSPRAMRDDSWYYVWTLARADQRGTL